MRLGGSSKLSELRHFFEIERDLQRPQSNRPTEPQREIQLDDIEGVKKLVRGRRKVKRG